MRRRHSRIPETPPLTAIVVLIVVAALGLPMLIQHFLLAAAVGAALLAVASIAVVTAHRRRRQGDRVESDVYEEDTVRVIPLDDAGIERALRDGPQPLRTLRPVPVQCSAPPTPSTSTLIERLHGIDWFQFERLMAAAFRKHGYRVERRGGAHADDGIDLLIERDGLATAVQCKHWKAWKVNPKTVRELLGAMTGGHVAHGMILTLKGYTAEARVKAREYGIAIWGEPEIVQLLRTVDAEFDPEMLQLLDDQRKYCPRCESEMVLRTAKRGPSAGGHFWGCSRYPACNYTLTETEREAAVTA